MMSVLKNYPKVALVTGASSGIGEAFARRFAALGYDLVLVARRLERLETLKAEISMQHSVQVYCCAVDLMQRDAGELVESFVRSHRLQIGILLNNAGYGLLGDFGERPIEQELGMVDLNCRAVVDLTHRFLPELKSQKSGAIIIISSVVGSFPVAWFATYAATKAFDLSFGAALALELRPFGVDVLTVLPGLTRTEFQAGAGMRNYSSPYREASDVVETALAALGKRPIVTDGFFNKVLVAALRFLPLSITTRVVAIAMRSQLTPRK